MPNVGDFPGVKSIETAPKFRNRKKISSRSCVYVLQVTAKKSTKRGNGLLLSPSSLIKLLLWMNFILWEALIHEKLLHWLKCLVRLGRQSLLILNSADFPVGCVNQMRSDRNILIGNWGALKPNLSEYLKFAPKLIEIFMHAESFIILI